ncbi:NAD(P)/FAD-dependent oxidoreductase [Nocardia sp. GCM10030253]|uniref:NAD(P)/FAD-dependent oxidoreductase n=1 Tax=Nocardia sp. GCM10030253 TaxID=3273404 RepID=UPI00362526C4
MFEVIVVGGGPAGLSAALTLGRAHRRVLVLDSGHPRNAPAGAVHNFFTRDGVPPAELRAIGRDQLTIYPTVEVRDGAATGVAHGDRGFIVQLADGTKAEAKRLLLASGLVDQLPDISGIAELWGRAVFHCPYCHGFESSQRPIAVIGGEPERIRLALHLSRFSADIVLCTNGSADVSPSAAQAMSAAGVTVRCERITGFEAAGDTLHALAFQDGSALPREVAFVASTWTQRSALPALLGCATFPDCTVQVDEFHRTSVPGVYAAGDMARRPTVPIPLAAVVAAAASGTIAGSVLDQDLISDDFQLPNPFTAQEK